MIHGGSVRKRAAPAVSDDVAALCAAQQERLYRLAGALGEAGPTERGV